MSRKFELGLTQISGSDCLWTNFSFSPTITPPKTPLSRMPVSLYCPEPRLLGTN